MRTIWAMAILLTSTAAQTSARCPGDFNLDETTTVDEIVAAVNAALNGCPAPVGCPFHFDEATDPDEDCFFVGRHHPICGPSNLEALFFSDAEDVIVSFFDPDVDFYAAVVNAEFAMMYAWEEITNPPSEPIEIVGEVLLSLPPREALTVTPFENPFTIDECNFEEYDGRFAEYVAFFAALAKEGGSATAARRAVRRTASKTRLQVAKADPVLSRLKREALSRPQGTGSRGARRNASPAVPHLDSKRLSSAPR